MKKLKIKNGLNNNFNSTHPTPLHQYAVNEALTSLFCLLAFLFLYACGTASIDSPTPPSTTTHKVTFNPNTPSATSATVSNLPAEQKVNEGDLATKPATPPTLEGYTFGGWYTEASNTTAFQFSTKITKATTLYAKWTPRQTFTITYHANKPSAADVNVTGVPENPVSISEGQTATAPTPPTLTGYNFVAWYTEEAATNPFDFSQVITANIDLYAKWTIQGFTVTYHANKPSDAPADATVTGVPATPTNVDYNQTTTAPTPPTLTGYNFVAWYTEEAATNQFDFSQVITANIDLYAKWTIQGFTVTYDANKPSDAPQDATVTGVPAIPTNVNYNQTITAPTPPTLTGYNFVAWYTEVTTTNLFDFSQGITASIDLYAKWSQDPIVTYDTQGGNAIEPQTITGSVTRATRPDNPKRDDYAFDDWYTMATGGDVFVFTRTITASITIYAQWIQQFTVTYHANKPSDAPQNATVTGVPATPTNVNYNQTTTAPTPPTLAGYNFVAWYTEPTATNQFNFSQGITTSIDLYAKWSQDPVVTFDTRGGSVIEPQRLTETPKRATRPDNDPTREDYTFDNWYTTADTGTTQFNFDQDITAQSTIVYARWNRITRTVTYHGNKPSTAPVDASITGLTTDPKTVTVNSGDRTTAITPAPELTGYTLDGWFIGTISGGILVLQDTAFDFTQPVRGENISLYAKWTKDPVVTFDTRGGSPIDPQRLTGTPKRATRPQENPTRDDYTFDNWYTTADTGTTQFNFDQDITAQSTIVYARWNRITRTVTYHGNKPSTAPEGATITGLTTDPTIVTVNSGDRTTAIMPAPELTGYTLDGWFIGTISGGILVLQDTAFDFTQPVRGENINLYAKWTAKPTFTVSYNANKPTSATANVEGMPTNVKVIINLATTEPSPEPTLVGYTFEGWYTEEAATNVFRFSTLITTNFDLYAKWTAKPTFTVSYNANKPTGTVDNVMGVPTDVNVIINLTTTEPSPEPTLVGYTFEGWYTEPTTTTAFDFTRTITVNIDLYAKWAIQEFTVTYDANKPSGATATNVAGMPESVMINYNLATAEPSSEPTLGRYTFEGWYTEQAATTKFVFTTPITEDKTLYAKWVFRPSTKDELLAELNRAITIATPSPYLNYIDTSLINDMSELFKDKSSFNGNISEWNVSNVNNMNSMFSGARFFNQNISSWNVSLVKNMSSMFNNAWGFNEDISGWNVAMVTNMSNMFSDARSFNQNISSWNVSEVTNMSYMFNNNAAFNQNISSWNVAMVTNMSYMFSDARGFNQNISSWNVAMVTNMSYMFANARVFNQNISSWNVSEVTNMSSMFNNAWGFNQNISSWNVAMVTNMSNMFNNNAAFNQNISSWNVSEVTNMSSMFNNARGFNGDISGWNVSLVENMSSMFNNAWGFNGDISGWNVAMVTNMESMFENAQSFNQNISSWNVSEVTNMSYMFNLASVFNQNISSWDVSNVTFMNSMFTYATAFNGNISSWNVSRVTDMSDMFNNATVFNVNISNWRPTALTNMANMFRNASAFTQNINSWNIASSVTKTDAFTGSGLASKLPSWAM